MTTFVVLVEDRPGVLTRVAEIFRRRSYNIDSLTVGHTDVPGQSRMTIVCDASDDEARRLEAHLYKLVNVLRVDNITARPSVHRDLALIRVAASPEMRAQIMSLAEVFRARVVDVALTSLVLEVTGTEDKVDAFLETLRPYGVMEMGRTGRVSMTRGLDTSAGRHFDAREAAPAREEDDDAVAQSV
jgi:acetolactate synthase-1/3 small subunit